MSVAKAKETLGVLKSMDGVPSFVETFVTFLKTILVTAGAGKESSYERDGAFSYHAETHAFAVGLGGGFYYAATGDQKLLAIVYEAAVYGKVVGKTGKRARIIRDIVQEPHYALGGVVVGAVIGILSGGEVTIPQL